MAETTSSEVARPQKTSGMNEIQSEHVNYSSLFEILCIAVSASVLLADLATDVVLFVEYWMTDKTYWAMSTLLLIIAPSAVVQVFSIKWYISESALTPWQWISHVALSGHLYRHISLLISMVNQHENKPSTSWYGRLSDLHLLNLFRSFLQSAPQVALQSYSCIESSQYSVVKVVSLAVSLTSLMWSGVVYTERLCMKRSVRWASVLLRSGWYCAMLATRLIAIVLFSVVFGLWTLVPLCIHWVSMTVWIISQRTEFCPTKMDEILYNIVIGFVYCFCYFNLREGRTKYRLLTFYTFIVTQNLASLLLFMLASDLLRQRKPWAILATICIVVGTVVGLCCMITYYKWFHPNGPIAWRSIVDDDMELNNKDSSSLAVRPPKKVAPSAEYGRSLKIRAEDLSVRLSAQNSREANPQPDVGNTDKKSLLEHWIARSATPTFVSAPAGIELDDTGIEIHTVENTPRSASLSEKTMARKKQSICSPTELNLKLSSIEHLESSLDELTSSNMTLQKRRGICSSDELTGDLDTDDTKHKSEKSTDKSSELSHDTDSSNKKTSSDSIDMDLELSFSDINSCDINDFNENIVQKLCLSALKNIKVGNQDADIQNIQRIALDILKEMYAKKGKRGKMKRRDALSKRDLDTPTEVLSVHDYENICAVNIAREVWGLRSWNVYSDIENWQHDGSVVRDRRRDTLTSASSEISSCISQELRQQILAASQPRAHTYSNVLVDRSGDYSAEVLVDGQPGQLEPILEEIDDFGNVDAPCKPRLNSESSLVATIDEIRKGTITNSPRNVYHRHMWDSPQMPPTPKIETSLKRALWKEPSKFDISNTLESLPEKENARREFKELKFSPQRSGHRDIVQASPAPETKVKNRNKINNLRSRSKQNNTEEIHDLSNKDIDFLWQLVSDNGLPLQVNSIEDLSNGITSSLQSLIQKDNVPSLTDAPKSHAKKLRNRPRRKFSLLREHFEPKVAKTNDVESQIGRFESRNFPACSKPAF